MLNADTRLNPAARRLRDSFEDQSIRHIVEFSMDQIDEGLPAWARRSHPVIRRHLGSYWKTFTPDITVLGRLFSAFAIITLLSAVIPTMYTLLVPTVTVSLVMLPAAGWLYVNLLYNVGSFAAATVNSERRHNTLDILRSTPLNLREILLCKGAASIWRYIEDLNLVTISVLLTSLPLLMILYNTLLNDLDNPLLIALTVVAALASVTLRIVLETIMMAALGMLMGATNFARSAAVVSTMLVGIGYFVMLNGARLVPFGALYVILVEIVVPLVLPIIITIGCLFLTIYLLQRD